MTIEHWTTTDVVNRVKQLGFPAYPHVVDGQAVTEWLVWHNSRWMLTALTREGKDPLDGLEMMARLVSPPVACAMLQSWAIKKLAKHRPCGIDTPCSENGEWGVFFDDGGSCVSPDLDEALTKAILEIET